MTECNVNKICFANLGVDPGALQTIIKYIYTHDETLFTEDIMAEVMQLADFLQCKPIIDLCLETIIRNPGVETLPLYVKYSQPTKKWLPYEVRKSFIPDHFLEMIHHPNFTTNISDIEDLKVILDAILPLICNSEYHILVFQVLVLWLAFSKNRKVHASEILKKIQYDLITQEDITNVVLPRLTELPDCGHLIDFLRRYIENPFEQPFMSVGNQRFRKDPVIHAFGVQDDVINLKSDVMAFNLNYVNYIVNYWPLCSKFPLGILEPKGDCIEHYAFIVGGYTQEEGSETKIPSDSFIRYNMLTQEILTLKDLPEPTFSSAVVFHEKACQLWVIGGVVKKAETYQLTEEVHIYDVKTNEWKKGPSLPEPLSQLAVCNGSDAFDRIFISGGVTMKMDGCAHNRVVRKTVYMIAKDASHWTELATLDRARYGHTMYIRDSDFEGKRPPELYVIGGKSPDVLQEQNINGAIITDNRTIEAFSLHNPSRAINLEAEEVLGNCFGHFSLDGESYLFSECFGSESETVVNNWCDYGGNNSPFTGFTGLCQRKLPFSLKGALILPCWQKFDLKSNSKGPDVETSFLPSLSNGEESEEEEDEEEDGSEDSDY